MMILVSIISVAAFMDILTYKIKNSLIVCAVVVGFFFRFMEESWTGILSAAAGIAVPILCLWLLFCLRALGAGDIKLLSVVGCFLGASEVLNCILYSIFIGGVMSLGKLLYTGNVRLRFHALFTYLKKGIQTGCCEPYRGVQEITKESVIHFSIAILLGVLLCWEGM